MFKNIQRASVLVVAALTVVACNQPKNGADEQDGLAAFNQDNFISHVKILSSNEFKGRRPFTVGETKSIAFLQAQFKTMGLEPGNGSSYLQDVPMVEISPKSVSALSVKGPKGSFELRNIDEFVMWTERTDTTESLSNDDIVFAGFGVVAPEYNWNDYTGLDVKGKVVMVMVNDPGFGSGDSTFFKGNTMTYYGRWTYKYEEAARQGAKGCIIIHNTAAASYPFNVVQNSNSGVKLHLDKRANQAYQLAVQGWVTHQSAIKILMAAGKDTAVFSNANKRGFKGFDLNTTLSVTVKTKVVFNQSHNVIAKITGTKRPDECIVYTAHWDHFGVGKPDEKGDTIYHGALDNGSGVAAILEIAKAFKSLKTAPERTIVFLSVTAEEQGLLGSEYYAQHPIFPVAKTVADLNIDEINNYGKTKDLSIHGQGQSFLEDYVRDEAKKAGRYIAPETHPEAGHYFRSDHFNFAKVGVPSVTVGAGIDVEGRGKAYGQKRQDDYNATRYHRPADVYDPTWNIDGGMQDIELLFEVGKRLSFETTFPQWKDGSEFKKLRH